MNKFATMKIGDDVDFYALVESSQKDILQIKVLIMV